MKPRIKICCISSQDEAKTAIEFGASAIGLVAKMPSGPGPISDDLIRQISMTIPPPIGTFLLTSGTSVMEIINHHKRTNTNTIQTKKNGILHNLKKTALTTLHNLE